MIIEIDTNNDIFKNLLYEETARILKSLAEDLNNGKETTKLYDIYGNHVGNVEYN